jgi:hypothetical protein
MKIREFPYPTENIGGMDMEHNTMYLKKDLNPEYLRGVILHEVQHMIQKTEGFARGGNVSEFKDQFGDKSFEMYKRLMGEVEARNIQSRMDFNEAQRMVNPRTTEDRPRFVQVPAAQNSPAMIPGERPNIAPSGGIEVEQLARKLAEAENGKGSWDRIGGGGQEHYWRDAERTLKKSRPKNWDK